MTKQKAEEAAAGLILPRSDDAEKGLLASMLHRPALVDDTGDLPLAAIYDPTRRKILETMREMAMHLIAIDQITLTQKLDDAGELANVGGGAAVTELYTFIPSPALWEHYLEIVREKWVRRRVIEMAFALQQIALEDARDIEEIVSRSEETVLGLRAAVVPGNVDAVKHCEDATKQALDHIEAVYHARGKPIGMTTGLFDWDRMTGGFLAGEMIVIGARPSSGKTALGMQIAEHVALDCGIPTLVFSVEMPAVKLMKRTIMSRAKISLQRLRDGFMSKEEEERILPTSVKVAEGPLYLDETGELTVSQFRSRARIAKVRHKIGFIVVDYLQLMRSLSKRAQENRQIEVAEISGSIKAAAKELGIPILALAQLNRDVEGRGGMPRLSDLKESGAMEQDADQVVLIHRLDTATKRKRKAEDLLKEEEEEEQTFNTLLLLEKQRDGAIGDIKVKFIPTLVTFENVTKKLYSNKEEERQQ
jgi:replicative DNA helicase